MLRIDGTNKLPWTMFTLVTANSDQVLILVKKVYTKVKGHFTLRVGVYGSQLVKQFHQYKHHPLHGQVIGFKPN